MQTAILILSAIIFLGVLVIIAVPNNFLLKLFRKQKISPDQLYSMVNNLIDGLNRLSVSLDKYNAANAEQLHIYRLEIERLHTEIGQNLHSIAQLSAELDESRGNLLINEFLKKNLTDKINELTQRFEKLEEQIKNQLNK